MLGTNDRGNSEGKDALKVAAMPCVRLRSRIVNMSETMMLEPQNVVRVSMRHNDVGRSSDNETDLAVVEIPPPPMPATYSPKLQHTHRHARV